MPSLALELRSVDVFLAPQQDGLLRPRAGAGPEAESWRDLWDTFELLRLLLARPEVWGSVLRYLCTPFSTFGSAWLYREKLPKPFG